MKTRVITSIVALAVFVGVLLAPPIVFTVALSAVVLFMLYECYRTTKADTAMKVIGVISSVGLMITMYFIQNIRSISFIVTFITATAILLCYMILAIIKHGKKNYKDILASGFLTLYVTVSMWCIVLTRTFFNTEMMLLIFISAWSCDTCAYFSGRFFGKHKLIPHVSPNKTVEGALGGALGAAVGCLVYLLVLSKLPTTDFIVHTWHWVIGFAAVGLAGGICSQIGDLIASSIKRDEDIKDFGWIFPGHGGFMDRFDSVLFVSPVILIVLVGSLLF